MAVEILSVSLSDETIEGLANAVARLIRNQVLGGSQPAAESNPPSSETHRTRRDGVSEGGADPWTGNAPPPPNNPQPDPNQAPAAPRCEHGEMRFVKAGFSKNSGKAYNAFYGCPAPRGAQQCKSVQA